MRYGIFSDIHANWQAWEAVQADALRQRVGTLICLGDVVGYGPKPLEVLTSVRRATPNFVLGNHDAAACGRLDPSIFNDRARAVIEWTRERLDDEALGFLNQVPLQMDGEGIEFVHAEVAEPGEFGYVDGPVPAGESLRAMTRPLAFIGHTHLPMAYTMPENGGQVEQLPPVDFQLQRGRRTLVNVGSVGEPRTTDVRASYVIYDDVEQTVCFRQVIFDVDGYKADLAEVGLDILPYFVQVVDTGKVAGARPPVAGPQLAMAELPKVLEGVSGNQGHLVQGTPAGMAGAATTLKQSGNRSKRWIVAVILLIAACVAGTAIVISRGNREPVAAGDPEETQATPAANPGRRVDADGSLTNLKAKLFARNIASLAKLREIEKTEFPLREIEIADGLLDLTHGRELPSYGLIWLGDLQTPQPGVYEITLDCDDGAALFLDGRPVIEVDGQNSAKSARTAEVTLGPDPTRLRLEFYQSGGAARLDLTWTGPHS